jgi:transposase
VLDISRDVYHDDAIARRQGMSPEERLTFHKTESGPRMEDLQRWMADQINERKVAPNSGLGEAILYTQKRWDRLTRFLQISGVSLDNNAAERILKKAILSRKNRYFYKTARGAHVGYMFMSLIHTAEFVNANPFDYLTELQKHTDEVKSNPSHWMPWNYRETINQAQAEIFKNRVIHCYRKDTIQLRMKQSGIEWSLRGANAIISLRCLMKSGRLEDYWESRAQ